MKNSFANFIITIFCLFAGTLGFAESVTFKKADRNYRLSFPRDHGSHPEFETEWWYITGHLVSKNKSVFESPTLYGFQLTFFRRASADGSGNKPTQTFLAQAALTDMMEKKFISAARFADGETGIAGASNSNLKVWNTDWLIESFGEQIIVSYNLGPGNQSKVRLILKPSSLLIHGDNGYSLKGNCADCASHYYSLPRIELSGSVEESGAREEVSGLGWYDHEFMTNALAKNQIGWDWMNLMFKDGTNLMAFALRTADNPRDFVSGSIQKNGAVNKLATSEIKWQVLSEALMPGSNHKYPSSWLLESSLLPQALKLDSLLEDQEVVSANSALPPYWEGAIRAQDAVGYFEMTGYENSGIPKTRKPDI